MIRLIFTDGATQLIEGVKSFSINESALVCFSELNGKGETVCIIPLHALRIAWLK